MSAFSIDPVATLATAKTLADLLPPEGRMELMRHLMSRATPQCMERFMAEMPDMLAKMGAAMPSTPAASAAPAAPVGSTRPERVDESGPGVAAAILDSWLQDPEGFVSVTVPAGISDLSALRSLNQAFRSRHPEMSRDAISSGDYDWYFRTTSVAQRDVSRARVVRLQPVVPGTRGLAREAQDGVLRTAGLRFAEPIEQALVAAAFACKFEGRDVFQDFWARGSMPGHTLTVSRITGTRVCTSYDDGPYSNITACGALAGGGEHR